ncbi:MAG: AAA family ATPase [Planctomycetota bacterium]
MTTTIAVTGKGGVGKTLIAALMIRFLKEHTPGPILAIDADPDSNLGTLLGIPAEHTIGDMREETLEEIKNLPPGMDKAAYIEMGLQELIVETEKVDFLAMGRSEGPGCYCYVNHLLRKFSDDLLPSYQWMVMDSEAGMEHLSRRTAGALDHLVVVVTQNPLSLDAARRIGDVAASVHQHVKQMHFLVNDVREDRVEAIREKASGLDMDYLGHIPHDDAVEELIFDGRSLYELGDSVAGSRISEVMQKLGA